MHNSSLLHFSFSPGHRHVQTLQLREWQEWEEFWGIPDSALSENATPWLRENCMKERTPDQPWHIVFSKGEKSLYQPATAVLQNHSAAGCTSLIWQAVTRLSAEGSKNTTRLHDLSNNWVINTEAGLILWRTVVQRRRWVMPLPLVSGHSLGAGMQQESKLQCV